VAQPHMAPVIDLMEALKKSLAEKQAPVAAVRARSASTLGARNLPPRAVHTTLLRAEEGGKEGNRVNFNMGATDTFSTEDVQRIRV